MANPSKTKPQSESPPDGFEESRLALTSRRTTLAGARKAARAAEPRGLFQSSDLAALQTELQTDPTALGYAAPLAAGNHQVLANLLNQARAGIVVRRGIRSGLEVVSCIALAEYEPLTVGRQQYLIMLTTPVEGCDLSNDVIRANLGSIFAAGATRTRLLAMADKTPASRAEQLWGVDTMINAAQVAQALAL